MIANTALAWTSGLLPLLIFACCSPGAAWAQRSDADMATTLCTACHRDHFARLDNNPHTAVQAEGAQRCIACHGDVGVHRAAGGGRDNVFAFRGEAPRAQAERCLGCHGNSHPGYERSAHAMAGLACGSCHVQHDEGLGTPSLLRRVAVPEERASLGAGSAVCFDCHGEIFTEFSFNERHRLQEGVLGCESCHDPHAPQSRVLLGGFKQEQCTDCHSDKRGPFVFEHAASRIEGCTACHSAHGAPNRHLLTHQRTGELCYSCHAAVPQFHLGFAPVGAPRFGLDTQCTNCHSTIHGSNFDPAFLR